MTDITPERLAEIKARTDKATAGPWEFSPEVFCGYGYSTLYNPQTRDEIIVTGGKNDGDSPIIWMGEEMLEADRVFIEQARQDIPDLIAALEAAQAEIARLRKALETIEGGAVARRVAKPYLKTGERSKYDQCGHSRNMWEDCPDCIMGFARAALEAKP